MSQVAQREFRIMQRICLITTVAVAIMSASAEGQEAIIKDPTQLIGKKVIVERMPLCQVGTFKTDLEHAGQQATVVSAKPSTTMPALSAQTMQKLPPEARATIEDQQRAATLVLQFNDGVKLDTCAPMGPSQLSGYLQLAPGETLEPATEKPPATPPSSAPGTSAIETPPPTETPKPPTYVALTIHIIKSYAESDSEVSADNTLRNDPISGLRITYTAYTADGNDNRRYVLEVHEGQKKLEIGQSYAIKSISGNTVVILVPGKKHPAEVRAHIKSVSER